jgi:hypothetical protein
MSTHIRVAVATFALTEALAKLAQGTKNASEELTQIGGHLHQIQPVRDCDARPWVNPEPWRTKGRRSFA